MPYPWQANLGSLSQLWLSQHELVGLRPSQLTVAAQQTLTQHGWTEVEMGQDLPQRSVRVS